MFARDRQTNPWVEQWKRVDRCWNKLQAAYGTWTPTDEMVDVFFAFFQNTYQMRDWFLASGLDRAKVNAVFKSPSLRLCRDIANGTKHCRIDRRIDRHCVDPGYRIVREDASPPFEEFRVIVNGRKIGLYGLCSHCISDLQGFLIGEGLWGTESAPTCSEFCFGPQ